jgi:(4S)-4-hydroxy-5-phosphonooxypentane-2,3-dione isomerase
MYTIAVTIHVKPECRDKFIAASLDDARGSVQNEPDCFCFDVIQDEADPNCFYLYEVYRDPKAFQYHLQAPHFLVWKEATKDCHATPPVVGKGNHLFPPDSHWKK